MSKHVFRKSRVGDLESVVDMDVEVSRTTIGSKQALISNLYPKVLDALASCFFYNLARS